MPSSVSSGCAGANSPTATVIDAQPAFCHETSASSVGAVLPDRIREAEDELDDGLDYFQAQGRIARQELEGGIA